MCVVYKYMYLTTLWVDRGSPMGITISSAIEEILMKQYRKSHYLGFGKNKESYEFFDQYCIVNLKCKEDINLYSDTHNKT